MKLTEKEVLQLMKDAGAGPNDLIPRGYVATVELFSHVANAAQPPLREQVALSASEEDIQAFLPLVRLGKQGLTLSKARILARLAFADAFTQEVTK